MEKLPPQFEDIRKKGIFISIEGNLRDAGIGETFRILILTLILVPISLSIVVNFVFFLLFSKSMPNWLNLVLYVMTFVIMALIVYYWGWKKKFEAWYYFDHGNEIFYALINGKNPTLMEIPYEEIEEIRWVGGNNGYAKIITSITSLPTERAMKKREGSSTELWSTLALIGAPFTEWPIKLWCPSCNRVYGHNIGTATCPFEPEIALIDPDVKGRHDPEGIAEEDLDRL